MPRNIKVSPIDTAIARVLNGEYHKVPGMSRPKISEASGIPPATLQRMFSGDAAWSVSQFLAVIDAIGTHRQPDVIFREAINLLPVVEAELSEAAGTVADISDQRGYKWQGEDEAVQKWDAVAKSTESVIEINPEDHTP